MRLRIVAVTLLAVQVLTAAPHWTRFRGPNGAGVADGGALPVEFGKQKNLIWHTALAPGFSSPVLGEQCVYVTSYDGPKEALGGFTHCIDRNSGKELWKKHAFTLDRKFLSVNTPVSPTPVTDGTNVYVFFEAAGLISYDQRGNQRWKRKLGKFNNPYAMANSPILAGGALILQADQDTDAYLLALNAATGETLWKRDRPDAQHGYSTPILYRPKNGPEQVIVSGSYQVAGYSVKTGEKLWWVDGMAWQAKSVPVLDGDMLYVHSWMAELNEIASKLPKDKPWEEFAAEYDKDKDGKISKEEAPDPDMPKLWFLFDLDRSGMIEKRDYDIIRARTTARSGLFAIQLGGSGDITRTAVKWKAEKQLPNIPSPLLYRDVLYILKEGGILTAYHPKTGAILKQGRVDGAIDAYFASPVAGDGKIYTAAQDGKVAVLKAAAQWEVLKVNEFDEEIWSTPAIEDGRIYLRTQKGLYCFGLTEN